MVEGEQMGVAEQHNTLGVGAHGSNIATELVPGEDDADRHHTIERASRPWASAPAGSTAPAVLTVRRVTSSLNNQSLRLARLGRREHALAAIEDAVELYRELAAARPDAFRADLAASLTSLGIMLT